MVSLYEIIVCIFVKTKNNSFGFTKVDFYIRIKLKDTHC